MPVHESESLVLRSYGLAEADRIVVFFTRDHGIVRGVAKGAKRLNSRFSSTLEPFSTVHLEYFQKDDRELVSIRQVDLVRSIFSKADNEELYYTLSYFAELLMVFSPPHDADATLYRMTQKCIAEMIERPLSIRQMQVYFELWMLRLGGFLPRWNGCDDCGRAFPENENALMQANFHLLCSTCNPHGKNVVSSGLRKVFHNVQKSSPADFAMSAEYPAETIRDASNILQEMIARVAGRGIRVRRHSHAG